MRTAVLGTLYNRAIRGIPVLGTPDDVVRRFSDAQIPPSKQAERITTLYASLCGATGFVCGIPGFLLLPVTLPTNLAGVAVLQLHMTAAIARLGGYDLEEDETRSTCIACLLEKLTDEGTNTEDEEVVARTGIKFLERGVRFAIGQVGSLGERAARHVVLRRTGISRLPLIGGIIGAGSDAYMTRQVAACAIRAFKSGEDAPAA